MGSLLVAVLIVTLVTVDAQTLCDKPPITPQDRRTNKSQLRLATFNLAWLFDGVTGACARACVCGRCSRHAMSARAHWRFFPLGALERPFRLHLGRQPQRRHQPHRQGGRADHGEKAFRVLAPLTLPQRLDADVIAVEEVESCALLDRLIAQLPSNAGYRGYLVEGTDTATGQNVALLTRVDPIVPLTRTEARASIPIAGSTCTTASSDTGVSKHFRTKIRVSSGELTLVAGHLKSGGLPSDCAQREGQAQVLRQFYTSSERVIFLGDFNDFSAVYTDGRNNRGTSRTLSVLAGSELRDVGELLAQADRISTQIGFIDHILLPVQMYTNDVVSVITDRTGYPTTSATLIAAGYSDHYPLMVTLRDSASAMAASLVVVLVALLATL